MVGIAGEGHLNHGRITSKNGRASRCRHCSTSRMTEVDGHSSQWMHLSEYTNYAWVSQVLVSWLMCARCLQDRNQ